MKRVFVAAALLLLVCAGCITLLITEQHDFSSLLAQTERMEADYRQGNIDAAREEAEHFAKEVADTFQRFSWFLPHDRLLRIQEIAVGLPILLSGGEKQEFLTELHRCRLLLNALQRLEYPYLENIL